VRGMGIGYRVTCTLMRNKQKAEIVCGRNEEKWKAKEDVARMRI